LAVQWGNRRRATADSLWHSSVVNKLSTPAPNLVWKLYFGLWLCWTLYGFWQGWWDALRVVDFVISLAGLVGLFGYAWALRVPGSARVWRWLGIGLGIMLVVNPLVMAVRLHHATLSLPGGLATAGVPAVQFVMVYGFMLAPAWLLAGLTAPNVYAVLRYARLLQAEEAKQAAVADVVEAATLRDSV
jgi:hypothetical protein